MTEWSLLVASIAGESSRLSAGEMHLITEPLFTLPSDNLHIISIVGMNNGRIFMAGKDSCLYELAYQVRKKFFFFLHSQVWKMNWILFFKNISWNANPYLIT